MCAREDKVIKSMTDKGYCGRRRERKEKVIGEETRDEKKEDRSKGGNLFLFLYLGNSKTIGTKMKKTTENSEFPLHHVQCVILSFS